jgi:hypothetical protein
MRALSFLLAFAGCLCLLISGSALAQPTYLCQGTYERCPYNTCFGLQNNQTCPVTGTTYKYIIQVSMVLGNCGPGGTGCTESVQTCTTTGYPTSACSVSNCNTTTSSTGC